MKKPPDPEERRLGKAINEIPGALERNLVVHVSEVVGLLLIGGHGGRIVVLGGLGLSVIAGTGSGLLAGGGAHPARNRSRRYGNRGIHHADGRRS